MPGAGNQQLSDLARHLLVSVDLSFSFKLESYSFICFIELCILQLPKLGLLLFRTFCTEMVESVSVALEFLCIYVCVEKGGREGFWG
jgi:hypothetical protein